MGKEEEKGKFWERRRKKSKEGKSSLKTMKRNRKVQERKEEKFLDGGKRSEKGKFLKILGRK